jgi:predicted Rossmann-fold nucleotide-binding protein
VTRRNLEVQSLAEFDQHLARATSLNGWFVQSLDLTARAGPLRRVNPRGAVFLGCTIPSSLEASLRSRGALLFPALPDLPFDPYRPRLYDPGELYGPNQLYPDGSYADSPDAAIYAWSRRSGSSKSLAHTLAAALHDQAISDALDEALTTDQVVGVMGGHALLRGENGYRAAAELGRVLTLGGRTVLTGGGPGAMEAANLGAYLSPWPTSALDEAIALLSQTPSYSLRIDAWIGAALAVRVEYPAGEAGKNLSIPTWFYGHEPTNLFATQIAKYFANSLREDTLLHRCRGGIVYLPGQAGTVQEIFQAVTENFYAADNSEIAPLILLGSRYWSQTYPAWSLLSRLAADRPMAAAIHCVDSVSDATAILLEAKPTGVGGPG